MERKNFSKLYKARDNAILAFAVVCIASMFIAAGVLGYFIIYLITK